MQAFLALIAVLAVGLTACSDAKVAPDVDATVFSSVGNTVAAMPSVPTVAPTPDVKATIESSVRGTISAVPTPTPYPTPWPTPSLSEIQATVIAAVSSTVRARPTSTPAVLVVTATPTATSAPAKWVEFARYEGEGAKTTASFTVSASEWQIEWQMKNFSAPLGSFLQIYVYRADGTLHSIAANSAQANHDYSVVHGAGTYYLNINAVSGFSLVLSYRE